MNKLTDKIIQDILEDSIISDCLRGEKTTCVTVILPNGFEITTTSSCVDSINYNHDIGVKLCMEKVKDKLYELVGFLLQEVTTERVPIRNFLN